MNKEIKKINSIINSNLSTYNNLLFKRNRKIDYTDVYFYLTQLINSPNNSSVTVASMISCDNISNATHDAYKKKRYIIDHKYLKIMANDLLSHFYKIKNNLLFKKYRVLCVDGTHSPLSKNLSNYGYKLTHNNTYINSLISGLYK